MKEYRSIEQLRRLVDYCKRNGIPLSRMHDLPSTVLDKVSVEKSTNVENSTNDDSQQMLTLNELLRLNKRAKEFGTSLKTYRPIDATYGREMRNAKGLAPKPKEGPRSIQKTPLGEARLRLLSDSPYPVQSDKRVDVLPEKRLTCKM